MVKDHSDSERRNPMPPHGLFFPINSKGSFYKHHPTDRLAHTTAFVTPVVEHWLEREIGQWVHPMKDRPDDPSHHERTLLPRSYISLLPFKEGDPPQSPNARALRNQTNVVGCVYVCVRVRFRCWLCVCGGLCCCCCFWCTLVMRKLIQS